MSMMDAVSKAKRYNDLVEDLQQKNVDKLIDNCDPTHLQSINNYVTKQEKSKKYITDSNKF